MLETIINELEGDYYLETNIVKKFQGISNDDISDQLKSEIMAFQFMEENQNGSNWGTYFGSYARFSQKDGSVIEIPSIKDINEDVLNYWEERISQTENPVLKARYSGLIWDLSQKISAKKPSHQMAVIYLESLIKIVEDRLQGGIDLIRKIERALSVAVSINNKIFIAKAKELMLVLEDEIGENNKPGLWGFSFDALMQNSKLQLTIHEKLSILQKLEQRLIDATIQDKPNTWVSECIIKRLAPYYRNKNMHNDAQRVVRLHGETVINKKYAMLLQYQKALKDLQKLYSEYGMKQESDKVLRNIKQIGSKVLGEMQSVTSEIGMTREEIDEIVIPLTSGVKKEVFHKLIHFFTPQIDLVKKSLFESAKENVFSSLFGKSIIDETGREVATIGTIEEDLIGNIIHHISQDLHIYSFYMRKVFNRLINDLNYTTDDFIDFVKDSAIISENRVGVIRKGIQAYFDNDFIVCEHLLIPQIETSLRNLIEQNDGIILEPSSLDAFQLKTFNKLLIDDIIKYSIGEDIQIYFRTLFTDPRGWNLRNKICHGLNEPNAFSRSTSERVIHSILIIGTLRRQTK